MVNNINILQLKTILQKNLWFLIFFFILIELAVSSCLYAEESNTGVVLADDSGNIIFSQNREKQFIPASILKILTSLAAINILGDNYNFPTKYLFDKESHNLYIKGFGDPLLISEVIEQLCHEIILKTQTKQINNIILDHTYFSEQIKIPGKGGSLNPYDASVGAICANFNTIKFKWNSQQDKFVSGEPQTPLLSIFNNDIKDSGLKQGRIILSQQQSILYPGFLIKYFLEKSSIKITGSVFQGKFDTKGIKTYSFQSPFKLTDIVEKLLKFSNNFIANQLLLVMGAKIFGEPATLEKGTKALEYFSNQNLNIRNLKIYEGSGLSRSNLISPTQMLKILIEFMPYYSLLKNKDTDYYKTGTLSDVRTRAGYILGKDNRLNPYVVMVNEKNRGYESILLNLIRIVTQGRIPQMVQHPISQ
jgi:serine-type D-Ala-D-Ala carboxypeptidase/endopeptidase (penicillin-binding protein 4)